MNVLGECGLFVEILELMKHRLADWIHGCNWWVTVHVNGLEKSVWLCKVAYILWYTSKKRCTVLHEGTLPDANKIICRVLRDLEEYFQHQKKRGTL